LFFLCVISSSYGDIDWRPSAKFGPCSAVPLNEKVVFGTNAGSLPYEKNCGNIAVVSGSMWFSVAVNQGETVDLTTIYPYTNFPTVISVFTGPCDDLQCQTATTEGSLTITPTKASFLYVSVSGKNNTSGSFAFSAKKSNLQQQTGCNEATEVYLNKEFPVVLVDQFPTQSSNYQDLCVGNKTNISWLKIFTPVAGTLDVDTSDNAEVSLFTGSCDDLQILPCNSYEPTVGEFAYVAVTNNGEGQNEVEFSLRLTSEPIVISSCSNAAGFFFQGPTTAERIFSTLGQNVMNNDPCVVQESPVYWFNMTVNPSFYYPHEGEDYVISFDTCSSDTNFDTLISIYSGSCSSLSCVEKTNMPCTNGENGSMLSFTVYDTGSNAGALYYIAIGAADGKSSGTVDLIISGQYTS